MGCEAAKTRLTPTDIKRKSDPEYKRGWNAYSGPTVEGQAPNVESATFEQGQADRALWERWFADLTGEFQQGAYWWSGQRSLPKPGTCSDFPGKNQEFLLGCEAAKARLTPTDLKRKYSADYKRGWNEYSGPITEPNTIDPSIQDRFDPDDGTAAKLNSAELKHLRSQ
jgi:hypothetical protein